MLITSLTLHSSYGGLGRATSCLSPGGPEPHPPGLHSGHYYCHHPIQIRKLRHRESQNFPGLCDSEAQSTPSPELGVCWPRPWATWSLTLCHLLLIPTWQVRPAQGLGGPQGAPILPQGSHSLPSVEDSLGANRLTPSSPSASVAAPPEHETPSQAGAAVTGCESSLSPQEWDSGNSCP